MYPPTNQHKTIIRTSPLPAWPNLHLTVQLSFKYTITPHTNVCVSLVILRERERSNAGFFPHWSGVVGPNHHSAFFYHHSERIIVYSMQYNTIFHYSLATTQIILGRTLVMFERASYQEDSQQACFLALLFHSACSLWKTPVLL